jgi:hypothetical protein
MVAFHREKNLQIMFIIALFSYLQLEASTGLSQANAVTNSTSVELQVAPIVTSTISDLENRTTIYPKNVDKPYNTMKFIYYKGAIIDGQPLFTINPQYKPNSFSVHDAKLVTDTAIHCISVFVPVLKDNEDELKKTQEALANHEALLAESTKSLNEYRDQNIELQMKLTFMQSQLNAMKNMINK